MCGMQVPSARQMLHQYCRSAEGGGEGLNPTAPDKHDSNNRAGDTLLHTEAGAGEPTSTKFVTG